MCHAVKGRRSSSFIKETTFENRSMKELKSNRGSCIILSFDRYEERGDKTNLLYRMIRCKS
jgi:hypothetical protein